MPITWDEFEDADPATYRLPNAASRLKVDPWANAPAVDLAPAIAAMDRQLEDGGFELPAFDRFGR
jgi:DNA primase